jgi:hypothetical protein
MPKLTACDHRRCCSGPCKMLSPEEIEPDAADVELGKRLVAEGRKSISTTATRPASLVPAVRDLLPLRQRPSLR